MNYQPPFDTTPEIIDLISQISMKIGFVEREFMYASPQLRKQNRIKTITGTLAIEGNSLDEQQITALLEGKKVLATEQELAEVKDAIAAYDELNHLNPNAVDDLLSAHKLMMGSTTTDAGTFRKNQWAFTKTKS